MCLLKYLIVNSPAARNITMTESDAMGMSIEYYEFLMNVMPHSPYMLSPSTF
jgi:hypothetical protein